jgi:N-terminal conserved domain of Nudc./CS domain
MSLPYPSTSASTSVAAINPLDLEKFDAPLIAMTNACQGDLRKLFYAFFSFLHRRTDFYVLSGDPTSGGNSSRDSGSGTDKGAMSTQPRAMGFGAGEAEKLLVAAFRQFPLRRIPVQSNANNNRNNNNSNNATAAVTSATSSTTSSATAAGNTNVNKTGTTKKGDIAIPTSTATPAKPSSTSSDSGSQSQSSSAVSPKTSVKGQSKVTKYENAESNVRYTEEGLQVPVGNGGQGPGYHWTQIMEECTVYVNLPPNLRSAKDLKVVMKPQHVSVTTSQTYKPDSSNSSTLADASDSTTDESSPIVLVQGDLTERIQPSESSWTLEDGLLLLVLYKQTKSIWKNVFLGDPEIDTTLVDNRRHINEYDESTQAQIRKIMFDQQQARLGLPSSDELSGKKPKLPPMPPGVEYIDQAKLDELSISKQSDGGSK